MANKEQWIAKNITPKSYSLGISGSPNFLKGSTFDILLVATPNDICSNTRFKNLIRNNYLIVEKYRDGVLYSTINRKNIDDPKSLPCEFEPDTTPSFDKKVDKVPTAITDNVAVFIPGGNIKDSGKSINDILTGSSGFGVSGFSGYSGINGVIGVNGASGFSGYSGRSGLAGTSGFSGYSGRSGLSGYSGASGAGVSGFSGYSGYSGTGVSGFSGYSGGANSLYNERPSQNLTSVGSTISVTDGTPVAPLTANGSYTLTSTPTIANGRDGQLAILINTSPSNSIILQDMGTLGGSNLRLGATTRTLSPLRGIIHLVYDSTMGGWVEQSFGNVLTFTASISGLTIDGSSGPTREVAAGSTSDAVPSFVITYVGVPSVASMDVNGGEISGSDYPISVPSPYTLLNSGTSPASIAFYRQTSVTATRIFTVTATVSGTAGLTRSVTVTYNNRRYVGPNSQSTLLSTTQVRALDDTVNGTSDLTNSSLGTFTVTTSSGEYIWYGHRSALTTITFITISVTLAGSVGGGNEIAGFTDMGTLSHTNDFGFAETFRLYRTTNTNFGSGKTMITSTTRPTNRFYMGPNAATSLTTGQILTLDDTSSGQSRLASSQALANNPNGGGTQDGWGNTSPGAGVPSTAITVTGSDYLWYCHPSAIADLSTIKDRATGFGIAGSYQSNISHTNDMGYTETYRRWRSDNVGIFPSGGRVDIT